MPQLLEYIEQLKSRLDKSFELPCKVGDKVYDKYFDIHEWEITQIDIYEDTVVFRLGNQGTDNYTAFHLKELGNGFFLTREEAEEALRERESK